MEKEFMSTREDTVAHGSFGGNCGGSALSRREWLRAGLRYPVLAGLAGIGVVLGLRFRNGAGAERCLIARPCEACELFRDCGLPRATETRRSS